MVPTLLELVNNKATEENKKLHLCTNTSRWNIDNTLESWRVIGIVGKLKIR